MADPDGSDQVKLRVGKLILFLVFALTWLRLIDFPIRNVAVSLDDSWQKAFGYFLKKGMQAGTDYVFTYGPLGYFNSPIYDPDLYWIGFCWELITRSLLVYYLIKVFQVPFSLLLKIVFLILVILFLPVVHRDVESLIFITLIGIHLTDKNSSRLSQTIGLVTLSALSLGKFFLLLLSTVVAFLCEMRHRSAHHRTRFSPILILLGAYCLGWMIARQSLINLPTYIFSSLHIATGYNESMAINGDPNETFLSIFLLFLLFTIVAHIARYKKEKVQLLVFLAGFILAWKQGFTRQDSHTVIFFGYALISVLLLVVYFGYGSRQRGFEHGFMSRIMSVGVALMCIIGSILGITRSSWSQVIFEGEPQKMVFTLLQRKILSNLIILSSPLKVKASLDRQEEEVKKKWRLPFTTFRVGKSTIDTLSYQQGFLLLNEMNWHPRPVFQSYSAYTSYLAKRNGDFFRGPTAPEFVLYKSQPLDNRLPATEDGLALFEILKRYVPDSTEESFLLLKKKRDSKEAFVAKELRKEVIRFGQEITIDKKFRFQHLHLDIRDTLRGRIRKLFYRSPYILINLKTKSGITHKYRLLPALARNGFLLTPLLLETEDMIHFYQPTGGQDLNSFTIETESPGVYFKNQVAMEIRSLSPPDRSVFSARQFALLRDSINSGLNFQMSEMEQAAAIFPLDISARAAPAYDHLALYGEGLVEADPVDLPAGNYKIVLFGYGSKAGDQFPKVEFYLDRKLIGTLLITKLDHYELPFQIAQERNATLGVSFINDDRIGKEDRNVFIKRLYVEKLQ